MKQTDFAERLEDFLLRHLPGVRNTSPNTVKNYSYTFTLLLKFLKQIKHLRPDKIRYEDLQPDTVIEFLAWLESERGNSISTRNQRLAAIHSFFRHTVNCHPERLQQCQRILAIQKKRTTTNQAIRYLPLSRVEELLAKPDINTTSGLRDATLLSLLYDSGMRVAELCALELANLRLRNPPHILVLGKGRKRRIIPIQQKTALLLRNYLRSQNISLEGMPKAKLFRNRQEKSLTRAGVRYILHKYATGLSTDGFCVKISPHTLRHSKAMHLLQSGVSLAVIQSILGHSNIRSTFIYAHADLQMMREAINQLPNIVPESSRSKTLSKPGILDWLDNLCKG